MKMSDKTNLLKSLEEKRRESAILIQQLQMWDHALEYTQLKEEDVKCFGLDEKHETAKSLIKKKGLLTKNYLQIQAMFWTKTERGTYRPNYYNYLKDQEGDKHYFPLIPAPPGGRTA